MNKWIRCNNFFSFSFLSVLQPGTTTYARHCLCHRANKWTVKYVTHSGFSSNYSKVHRKSKTKIASLLHVIHFQLCKINGNCVLSDAKCGKRRRIKVPNGKEINVGRCFSVWVPLWKLNWQQIKNSKSFSTNEILSSMFFFSFIYFSFFAISLCQFMTKSEILTCRTLLNINSLHIFPFQFLFLLLFFSFVQLLLFLLLQYLFIFSFWKASLAGGQINQINWPFHVTSTD